MKRRIRTSPPKKKSLGNGLKPNRMDEYRHYESASFGKDGKVRLHHLEARRNEWVDRAIWGIGEGALIQTPDGVKAIENLQPGEYVVDAQMKRVRINWIGACSLAPLRQAPPISIHQFSAQCFGSDSPNAKLELSPWVKIFRLPGTAVPKYIKSEHPTAAAQFVNDPAIIELNTPTSVRMYNLQLEDGESFIANNVAIAPPDFSIVHDKLAPKSELRRLFFPIMPADAKPAKSVAFDHPAPV